MRGPDQRGFCSAAKFSSRVSAPPPFLPLFFLLFPAAVFSSDGPKKFSLGIIFFSSSVSLPPFLAPSYSPSRFQLLSFGISSLSLCLPLELGVWKKRVGGGGRRAFKDAPPSLLHQSQSNSKRDFQRRREDPLCRLRCLDSRAVKALLCPPE